MKKTFETDIQGALAKCSLCLLLLILLGSCKKFIDVPPPITRLTQQNVYSTDATAAGVLTGLYSTMAEFNLYTSVKPGLSADELQYYPISARTNLEDYYVNDLNAVRTIAGELWFQGYTHLNVTNSALEGLAKATQLSPEVKQQLTGEAYFMRAYLLFTLSNLYGDIPLVTSSDYRVNNTISRSSRAAVMAQVISDLELAESLLSADYLTGDVSKATTERVRPNRFAASALLARAYLYNKEWSLAETQASKVISNSTVYALEPLSDVFKVSSKEAIWQLASSDPFMNARDARFFILVDNFHYDSPVALSPTLLSAFESGDRRKTDWISSLKINGNDYFFPFKYKETFSARGIENLTLLRLSEQLLIRAEARAQLAKTADARTDLNAVRQRAGLLPTSENDQQSLINLIYHERQVELFTEQGHRWNDLKRTGRVDAVMSLATAQKGGTWKSHQQLYPIPQTEIDINGNLTQNPGY